MTFDPEQVRIEPGHFNRRWHSCDYYAPDGTSLFHERTYTPWSPFKPMTHEQWMHGGGTRAEIEALAAKHGGKAVEEFYAPDGADAYFLAFNDTDKALAFCLTKDFDRLCFPMKTTGKTRA